MAIVAYCRKSIREKSGHELDAQLDKIKAVFGAPDAVFTDVSVSGDAPERPGMDAAIAALRPGDVFAVAYLDRLSRDQLLSYHLRYRIERVAGAKLLSADGEGTGDETAGGELTQWLRSWGAQEEKKRIRERLAGGKAQARRAGVHLSRFAPFGYDLDGKHLRINEVEQRILSIIRDLRAAGQTLRAIAERLEGMGVQTKQGKAAWHPNVVKKVLAQTVDESAVRAQTVAA